ncbi:MAG: aldo/keto reductase, partial [Firmicutes bacterium]|nr:aldo/keto reductase [Bacillota bacterium]
MEYREMKNLGIKTSLLGFGCMRFNGAPGGDYDREKAYAMIDRAYEAGVNYFDTAYVYMNGESEKILGHAITKYPRESYYVATKLPFWGTDTPEKAAEIFNESLSRLGTGYIDFYLLHAMNGKNYDTFVENGIVDYCEKLKEEGKIRYLGFSFHDNFEAFKHIITSRKWDFCQIQYNYMDSDEQATTKGLELAESLGVPVIIMEPIKGGTLAALPDEASAPLRRLDKNATDSSWALRWVASHKGVNVILSGMNEHDQLTDNLETLGNFKPLTDEEFCAVDEAKRILLSRVRNGCTGCRYCMPCPNGVDIPHIFSLWNSYARY